jgi:hypothetical protein
MKQVYKNYFILFDSQLAFDNITNQIKHLRRITELAQKQEESELNAKRLAHKIFKDVTEPLVIPKRMHGTRPLERFSEDMPHDTSVKGSLAHLRVTDYPGKYTYVFDD